jgi:hypothetical protein
LSEGILWRKKDAVFRAYTKDFSSKLGKRLLLNNINIVGFIFFSEEYAL